MMLLLIVFMVLSYTTLPSKANGCSPFIPSSLVTGTGKTGVIPYIRANSGGWYSTVQNGGCVNMLSISFSTEITGWRSLCLTVVTVQCDPDTAEWFVVSG